MRGERTTNEREREGEREANYTVAEARRWRERRELGGRKLFV